MALEKTRKEEEVAARASIQQKEKVFLEARVKELGAKQKNLESAVTKIKEHIVKIDDSKKRNAKGFIGIYTKETREEIGVAMKLLAVLENPNGKAVLTPKDMKLLKKPGGDLTILLEKHGGLEKLQQDAAAVQVVKKIQSAETMKANTQNLGLSKKLGQR